MIQFGELAGEAGLLHLGELFVVHGAKRDNHADAIFGRDEGHPDDAVVRRHARDEVDDVSELQSLQGSNPEKVARDECDGGCPISCMAAIISGVAAIMS